MSKRSKELNQRADKLQKSINAGKIKGVKLKRAKKLVHSLRFRARQAEMPITNKQAKKIAGNIKKAMKKATAVDKNQGFLPGFLSQMNFVRVEELVAEKVFSAIVSGEINLGKKAI